jgi:3-oxoacyl-[acyl-carrier-protein] synthase II
MKRVVITGAGAVCPSGNSAEEAWNNIRAGITGIAPITRFDASGLRWRVAGELKGFDARKYISLKEINRLDAFVQYAVAASGMAVQDSGLALKKQAFRISNPEKDIKNRLMSSDPESLQSAGVLIGSSRGGISTLERAISASGHVSPYLMPSTTISMAASYVAQHLGINGYCVGISSACASGAAAIGEAYRLIRAGYENLILCGGAEAPICGICLKGYGASGALSGITDSSASRPFDRGRDGFVLSEGACILVLEEYEKALKRGARIYGEIVGYGNTTDAFHQTVPSPEGEARAITAALNEAGLKPEDIGFISAHGTSTPLGDRVETEAIKRSLGRHAYSIPVTSLKSATGHMLAASGALEAALTLMSLKENVIPPTINLRERDPDCDLDYVTVAREADIQYAICNSFGFGGMNAVLIFSKPDV